MPVARGTRVPFQILLDYLAAGDSLDKLLEGFPSVSREQAVAALDAAGGLVGIDIDNASRKVQLGHLELAGMQGEVRRRAG